MFTVNDLIEILNSLSETDKERAILLAQDRKGNGFGLLSKRLELANYAGNRIHVDLVDRG